jgi:hypothetical protein
MSGWVRECDRAADENKQHALFIEMVEVLETIENDTKLVPNWLWVRVQSIVKRAKDSLEQ